MGFIATLLGSSALQTLVSGLATPLENIFRDYISGKVSRETLEEQLKAAMLQSFADVESKNIDSITKTYSTFIDAASRNPVMERGWAIVLYSQLAVLLWHQFFIPGIVALGFVDKYPTSGATADWSYALIALCLGAPAIASRIGPAANWASGNLKRLIAN